MTEIQSDGQENNIMGITMENTTKNDLFHNLADNSSTLLTEKQRLEINKARFLVRCLKDGVSITNICKSIFLRRPSFYELLKNAKLIEKTPNEISRQSFASKVYYLKTLQIPGFHICRALGITQPTLALYSKKVTSLVETYLELQPTEVVTLCEGIRLKKNTPFLLHIREDGSSEIIFHTNTRLSIELALLVGKVDVKNAYPIFNRIVKSNTNPFFTDGMKWEYDLAKLD